MIKIDGLTKKYRSKAGTTCVALDSIDLVLPDVGMVFIIGKSGSGKSTLLNVIGGLDSFDAGDITVFGNSLSEFGTSDYEAYRSDLVGFVFQDYHLIDELTVRENVTLFAADGACDEIFDRVISTVGISELLDRYPRELSGGQKQRVAIARGIVKRPKVILCDEPTGNLDRKTSTQIMELLHDISREQLVLIVSHNLSEAEAYADRIIELADGSVVSDISKEEGYEDDFSLSDGRVIIPYHKRLSEDDVLALNESIERGAVSSVVQNGSGFEMSDVKYEARKVEMRSRKINTRNVFRLFSNFLFAKKRQSIGAILIVTVMFMLFSVIQSFVAFDANGAMQYSLDERDPLMVVEKKYSSFPNNFYDDPASVGGGKTYNFYSQTIWTNTPHGSSWDYAARLPESVNLEEIFIHETYGLLVCDDEYLTDRFGRDGEIELLAGSLDDSRHGGILITDYFADSIIRHEIATGKNDYLTYEDIIGAIRPASTNYAGRISGIINTGYKDKYQELIDEYASFSEDESDMTVEEFEEEFRSDPRYIALVDDIRINLGISYTLDGNYVENFSLSELTLVKFEYFFVSVGAPETYLTGYGYVSTIQRNNAITYEDGEIALPYKMYNALFNTEYTADDAYSCDERFGQRITFNRYVDNNPKKGLVYTKEYTIKCLTTARIEMCDDDMRQIKRADWQPSRIYFHSPTNLDALLEYVSENEYELVSVEQSELKGINDIIATFHELFSFMQILIISLIALYLVGYGLKSMLSNTYQIGVIKALGGRGADIRRIFVSKTLIVGALTSLISVASAVFFIGIADEILVSSIESMAKVPLYGIEIMRVLPELLLLDVIILMGVTIFSSVMAALVLRAIKPVAIIKAKE